MSTNTYPQNVDRNAWYVHTDDGIIACNALIDDIPSQVQGETESYPFALYSRAYEEDYMSDQQRHIHPYQTLLDIARNAGAYVVHSTPSNRFRYSDQTPSAAPELLIGLEPSYEHPTTGGLWGLVSGYSDENAHAEHFIRMEVDVLKLAEFDEYDSWDEAKANLRHGGLV